MFQELEGRPRRPAAQTRKGETERRPMQEEMKADRAVLLLVCQDCWLGELCSTDTVSQYCTAPYAVNKSPGSRWFQLRLPGAGQVASQLNALSQSQPSPPCPLPSLPPVLFSVVAVPNGIFFLVYSCITLQCSFFSARIGARTLFPAPL